MENFTTVSDDLITILDLFSDIDMKDLASKFDVSETDLIAIKNNELVPSKQQLENIYNWSYNHGLYLNEIQWQEMNDDYRDIDTEVVAHGARVNIKGDIRLDASGESNDFALGFYIGQTLSQAAMFVSSEPNSSLYILTFSPDNLIKAQFNVSIDWMLAVAFYRNKIDDYKDHPRIKAIRDKVDKCDYVLAPIADNKMFEVIDAFTNNEITDLQCLYALSATHLGYQYVLKKQEALDKVKIVQHLYYCSVEKSIYNREADVESNTSMYKALIAKKKYSDEGQYIKELLT